MLANSVVANSPIANMTPAVRPNSIEIKVMWFAQMGVFRRKGVTRTDMCLMIGNVARVSANWSNFFKILFLSYFYTTKTPSLWVVQLRYKLRC